MPHPDSRGCCGYAERAALHDFFYFKIFGLRAQPRQRNRKHNRKKVGHSLRPLE